MLLAESKGRRPSGKYDNHPPVSILTYFMPHELFKIPILMQFAWLVGPVGKRDPYQMAIAGVANRNEPYPMNELMVYAQNEGESRNSNR